jgi:hypothetical protein
MIGPECDGDVPDRRHDRRDHRRLGHGQGTSGLCDWAYLFGGLCILVISQVGVLSAAVALLVFSAGFCMSDVQTGLNAFAPGLDSTVARPTSVSWRLGMGHLGSILGSSVGDAGLGWGFSAILGMLAVPAICAAVAIVVTQRGSAGAATKGAAAHLRRHGSSALVTCFGGQKMRFGPLRDRAAEPSLFLIELTRQGAFR